MSAGCAPAGAAALRAPSAGLGPPAAADRTAEVGAGCGSAGICRSACSMKLRRKTPAVSQHGALSVLEIAPCCSSQDSALTGSGAKQACSPRQGLAVDDINSASHCRQPRPCAHSSSAAEVTHQTWCNDLRLFRHDCGRHLSLPRFVTASTMACTRFPVAAHTSCAVRSAASAVQESAHICIRKAWTHDEAVTRRKPC